MNVPAAPAEPVAVVLLGASGDLARKKIVPALFALFSQGLLPASFRLYGFARSAHTDAAFRALLAEHLTCRAGTPGDCAARARSFLDHCFYCSGAYDSPDAYLDLFQIMNDRDPAPGANRLFYLATPPSVFGPAARALGDAGLVQCGTSRPWSRIVLEKPFGRDRESFDRLARDTARVFREEQTYRIDHYLGKEAVQNLMALRFANRLFEPVWNRTAVESVRIEWREDIGIEGRGGYYDRYGIVRDVMQNHLLQVLALIAMDRPVGPGAAAVSRAKLDVLRRIPPPGPDALRLGQYAAADFQGRTRLGYREETGVPPDSRTPTYAELVLTIENERWRGVPFRMIAGKALDRKLTEVRIRFKPVSADLFAPAGSPPPNELVARIQPDESLRLSIVSKKPGFGLDLAETALDLRYRSVFPADVPDAYERLLLDVMNGDKSLFPHADELAAAWDIFTPALREIEDRRREPFLYPFGADAP